MKRSTSPGSDAPVVLVLSDGTGATAAHVLDAALHQFQPARVRVVRRSGLTTPAQVEEAIGSLQPAPAVVVHTLASEALRRHVVESAERRLLVAVDLFGPLLTGLAGALKTTAAFSPGLLHELESETVRRADAMDFAIAHDDGLKADELENAEVVVVGVSRVSKSVTCYALAFHGTRAANVPLAADLEPPPPLFRVDPERVVCLTMGVGRLQMLRETRARAMRVPLDDYLDTRRILADLRFASTLAERHGWHTLDVSHRAVEETAREVLRLVAG